MKNYAQSFNQYESALAITPPSGVVALIAAGLVVVGQIESIPNLPPWIYSAALAGAVLVALFAIRRAFHSEVAVWLSHYERLQEARQLSEDVVKARLAKEILTGSLKLADKVSKMTPEQLTAFGQLPLSEVELMPSEGEFLVIPPGKRAGNKSNRVPMVIVRELVETWIRMVAAGRNIYLLPPVRNWTNSRKREFVSLVYNGLADAGLVNVSIDGDWYRGNTSATIASDVSPVNILAWLRVEKEYNLVED